MKKLLYTLFAFALIVACEKDMDDNYTNSINPIEVEVSNLDLITENIVSRLSGSNFSIPTPSKKAKGSASTARTGTATATCIDARADRSGNRLDGEVIFDGTNYFLLIRDEAEVGVGPFTPLLTVSFVKSADGSTFQVYSNGTAVGSAKSLSSGFSNLFEAPFTAFTFVESINEYGDYLADSSLAAAGLTCSTAPAVSWSSSTSGDVTTWTHPTYGSYTIQGAPFPLSGFLATMVTNTSGNTVLNYAGTTSSSVKTEIEDDYDGE